MSTYFKHQGKCAANLRSNTIDLEATLRPTYTPEQTVPLLPHPSTSPRRGRRPAIWSASTRCTRCPPGGEWRPCAAAAFRRGILILPSTAACLLSHNSSIPLPQAARGIQRRGAKAAERVGSLASLSRPVPRALHARHRACPSPANSHDVHRSETATFSRTASAAAPQTCEWSSTSLAGRRARTSPRQDRAAPLIATAHHCAIPSLRLRAVVCSFGTRRGRPIWALRRANARATSLLRKDGLCLRSSRGAPRSRFIAGSHAALPSGFPSPRSGARGR